MLKKTALFFILIVFLITGIAHAIDQKVVMEIKGMTCEL